jgi:hypothetical protein
VSLQEVRCIKMCDDHRLAVYTSDPDTSTSPIELTTSSEAELREWVRDNDCDDDSFTCSQDVTVLPDDQINTLTVTLGTVC